MLEILARRNAVGLSIDKWNEPRAEKKRKGREWADHKVVGPTFLVSAFSFQKPHRSESPRCNTIPLKPEPP